MPMLPLPGSRRSTVTVAIVALLALAVLRGGRMALYLPPWGLIDEEQHLDYIRSLAEAGTVPVANRTPLSPQIIESLFRSHRWTTFHWPTPSSNDPADLGLEGYSYEGFQPPLYYVLMAPVFRLLPGGVLGKLFALRLVAVALSLATVWITWRIASDLFPGNALLSLLPPLILVMLPERAMAASRVNNDVLLEPIAAAFFWVAVRILLDGLTVRRSLALGLFLGLGFLTKTSMAVLALAIPCILWFRRHDAGLLTKALAALAPAIVLGAPLILRNLRLYGDWSGFAGFRVLVNSAGPQLSLSALLSAAQSLFGNFWVVWWQGAQVGSWPGLTLARLLLAATCSVAAMGLWRTARTRSGSVVREPLPILGLAVVLVFGCGLAVLGAYFGGEVPVIQGRFLLPVMVPIVLLLGYGLWQAPGRTISIPLLLGLLIAVDLTDFFGNLLPWFYLSSRFFHAGQPLVMPALTVSQVWETAWPAFLSDKPSLLRPWLWMVLPMELGALATVGVAFRRLAIESRGAAFSPDRSPAPSDMPQS